MPHSFYVGVSFFRNLMVSRRIAAGISANYRRNASAIEATQSAPTVQYTLPHGHNSGERFTDIYREDENGGGR
jgi:hypothetical protein